MPVPPEYERASEQFYEFLIYARDISGLSTTHQTYTMVQGVLQAFRRRLGISDAIRFANILPIALRALFITDWDTDEPIRPFQDRPAMTREVQALRAEHNFSPDSAIRDVACALRRYVDETAFDELLSSLPPGAVEFWNI
jgi:uncharacterized protein (DUF2267 family)